MAWRARIFLRASGKGKSPLSERLPSRSSRVQAAYGNALGSNPETADDQPGKQCLETKPRSLSAVMRYHMRPVRGWNAKGTGCTSSIPSPNQGSSPVSSPAGRPFLGRRPARRRASRRIHSIWALEERISSAAQRSIAAQISGSMRSGYCFRAAIGLSPSCRANRC